MLVMNQLAFTLKILFSCATARSRRALGTVLTATLPPRGHISRYAKLLGLNRNSLRLKAAMRRRNMIFKDWTADYFVIQVGKRVVNKRGEVGVVTAVDLEKMTCSVQIFCSDGSTYIKDFTTKGKKRMRVIEPEFGPEKQKLRSDATSDSVKYAIVNFYRLHCATSPCAKHRVRQRIANKKFREEQMLVMQYTFDDLYDMFTQAHQSSPKLSKVSRTMFYRLRPWYLRFAKVDSCPHAHDCGSAVYKYYAAHKWTDEELWWVPKPLVVLTTAPQWARGSPLPTTSLLFRAACDERTCALAAHSCL